MEILLANVALSASLVYGAIAGDGSSDSGIVFAFLVTAITGVSGFTAYIIKAYIDDLRKQRDEAVAGWRESTKATDGLTATVRNLVEALGGSK